MKQFFITLAAILVAMVSHAASDVTVDGVVYTWSPSDGAYTVAGWDGETPIQSLHIRAEVEGLDVIAINNAAFEDKEDIVYLTIDEGITSIGENAFCRCTNLQVAILPEGLKKIEEEAFAFCSKLTTMVIPSTVTDIHAHAFTECTGVTDVYFMMTEEEQLNGFDWWDGVYATPGQEAHGGMEFNTNEHTVVHVPAGTYDIYLNSGKLAAWLLREDSGAYPLWWIVNYGVVGREYTVSDDLTAVYADTQGGLYAKDDNLWLMPDYVYIGEVDYMGKTIFTSIYDQSNWVELTGIVNSNDLKGFLITGSTITGTLLDKKNPRIAVSEGKTPEKGASVTYVPNTYIPASLMGRTQLGSDGRTYAFVQPKPQEFIHLEWSIYNEGDECFYTPSPDEDQGINPEGLKGGFKVSYDLYEPGEKPQPEDGASYSFNAINRRIVGGAEETSVRRLQKATPYVDGGVSGNFVVYPTDFPDEPIITAIADVAVPQPASAGWYTIDGRRLGSTKPMAPGLYINGSQKVVIR